jgi:hypothetical protein
VLAEGPDADTGHGSRGAGFCDASLVLDDAGIGADIVEDLEEKALVGGHLELLVDSATERGMVVTVLAKKGAWSEILVSRTCCR